MRTRLESALLFVLGLMGVTVSDADPPSDSAVDPRDRSTPGGDLMPWELAEARKAGNTCVIISFDGGPNASRAPASTRDPGEERCSNLLPSS
jgi:hypothetical protein